MSHSKRGLVTRERASTMASSSTSAATTQRPVWRSGTVVRPSGAADSCAAPAVATSRIALISLGRRT